MSDQTMQDSGQPKIDITVSSYYNPGEILDQLLSIEGRLDFAKSNGEDTFKELIDPSKEIRIPYPDNTYIYINAETRKLGTQRIIFFKIKLNKLSLDNVSDILSLYTKMTETASKNQAKAVIFSDFTEGDIHLETKTQIAKFVFNLLVGGVAKLSNVEHSFLCAKPEVVESLRNITNNVPIIKKKFPETAVSMEETASQFIKYYTQVEQGGQ